MTPAQRYRAPLYRSGSTARIVGARRTSAAALPTGDWWREWQTVGNPAQAYLSTADPGNSVADWPSPGQPGASGNNPTPSRASCQYADGTSCSQIAFSCTSASTPITQWFGQP